MENSKSRHGYLTLPRHSKLLQNELGYDLFGFYISLLMISVWYRGNKNFCRIPKTQSAIASELKINQSTVSRRFRDLEKYKYYVIRREKYVILGYLPLFLYEVASKIHSKDYANVHLLYADVHKINAELQEKYANLQDKRAQNTHQSFYSSSKDNSGSFKENTLAEVNIDKADIAIERTMKERE